MIEERKPEPLYQCQVTDEEGNEILVGPRSNLKNGIPAMIAEEINKAVALGKRKGWHDARVVPIENLIH